MNWLLINTDKEKMKDFENMIHNFFPNSVVYSSTLEQSSLENIYPVLSKISACLIFSESAEFHQRIAFIVGYLCGRKIPLYTNEKRIPTDLIKLEAVSFFYNRDEIEKFFTTDSEKIIYQIKKRESLEYLNNKGFPFTVESFADAICSNNNEVCFCYLHGGMNINSKDQRGTPLLNIAARNDNLEGVKWLLENGADINASSEDRGYTAIMDAVWKGNKEITKYLIEKGAEVNTVNKEGQTMLVLAVGANKTEICKILAENGADPDIPDAMGMSAYGYAKLFKKIEIAQILEKYHKES